MIRVSNRRRVRRLGRQAMGAAKTRNVIAVVAIVFTAIDLKKYAVLSMICYIGMGWCVVLAAKPVLETIPLPALLWLLAGGIAYTVGAVLYGLGKRHRYMHSVFHLFVLAGSILHFVCIFCYII